MANILVVDDVSGMRMAITEGLFREGVRLDQAEDGNAALSLLEKKRYDLVISDIRMPNFDGIELLKWIRTHQPEVKVILITGFSYILETQKAVELGANAFLSKPVKLNELTDTVSRLISGPIARGRANIEQDFYQIKIGDLSSSLLFKSALYIRVSPTNFIRVADTGDKISTERLELYRKKGLECLYCKVSDYDLWQKT